jgi:hypothetical protein
MSASRFSRPGPATTVARSAELQECGRSGLGGQGPTHGGGAAQCWAALWHAAGAPAARGCYSGESLHRLQVTASSNTHTRLPAPRKRRAPLPPAIMSFLVTTRRSSYAWISAVPR